MNTKLLCRFVSRCVTTNLVAFTMNYESVSLEKPETYLSTRSEADFFGLQKHSNFLHDKTK